jgi:hypothetical protein
MGCDIHLIVEKRVNGKWQRVNELPPRPCSQCEGRGHYDGRPNDKCYWCIERQKREIGTASPGVDRTPYHDRNYKVFAVLADVRNDGNVAPIAEARGLPDDCSHAEGKDEFGDKTEYGDHSFSWLTLAELRVYDWKQTIKDEGWVDSKVFAKWDAAGANGMPDSWCKGVGGGGVEHISNGEMRRFIKDGFKDVVGDLLGRRRNFYTLIQWEESLANYCKSFLTFMESLSGIGEPDDVRIVFGFDS